MTYEEDAEDLRQARENYRRADSDLASATAWPLSERGANRDDERSKTRAVPVVLVSQVHAGDRCFDDRRRLNRYSP